MAIVSARVRSDGQKQGQAQPKASRRSDTVRPSIREVCLVGLGGAGGERGLKRTLAAGGRVTWSGRGYRVEATQVCPVVTDGPISMRYVHLAALAEG
jgi:hypothetical protein